MAIRKTVRVLPAGVNVPSVRKVDILDSILGDLPVWLQTEANSRTFETVQDTGGEFPGIKTVCIDGYVPDGGGGGEPEATSVLDFAGGEYTVGVTPYSLTDALETDDDWGEVFNAAEISASGWVALTSSSGGKLKGAFAAVALADHVCVFDASFSINGGISSARYDAPDFVTVWEAKVNPSNSKIDDHNPEVDGGTPILPNPSAGDHTIAILRTSNKFAVSIDGAASVSVATPLDNSAANTFTIIIDGHLVDTVTVRSVKFYSAVGVTSVNLPTYSA